MSKERLGRCQRFILLLAAERGGESTRHEVLCLYRSGPEERGEGGRWNEHRAYPTVSLALRRLEKKRLIEKVVDPPPPLGSLRFRSWLDRPCVLCIRRFRLTKAGMKKVNLLRLRKGP